MMRRTRMSTALGWFSLGLGAMELLTPNTVARMIGARESRVARKTLRSFGAREVASGLSVLARPTSAAPMWTRVAGDAVDLASLIALLTMTRRRRRWTAAALATVGAVAACDIVCAIQLNHLNRRPMELPAI